MQKTQMSSSRASLMSAQVDVSEPTSASSFGCLVSNGYNFAVVRAYQSNEQPDYNVCPSHKSLHNLQASDSAMHTYVLYYISSQTIFSPLFAIITLAGPWHHQRCLGGRHLVLRRLHVCTSPHLKQPSHHIASGSRAPRAATRKAKSHPCSPTSPTTA